MAHLQGTDYVGSMVVLEDGLPNKREYRRFKVNGVGGGNDDYAAMEEVLRRRLQAYLDERDRPVTERGDTPGKFAYPPQLLLVDGGKGQLSAAKRVIDELGLTDEIPVAGLAKRFEEVYVPGRSEPVEIPRGSEALFMLQRIRDEAHRFANTFHRERRSKRMTSSALDGIPGSARSVARSWSRRWAASTRSSGPSSTNSRRSASCPTPWPSRCTPSSTLRPADRLGLTSSVRRAGDHLGHQRAVVRDRSSALPPRVKSGTMNSSKPSSA
jgi:hypothetical protein